MRFDEDYIETEVFLTHHAIQTMLTKVYAYHLRVQHLDNATGGTIAHLFVTEPAFLKAMALRIHEELRGLTGRPSDRDHLRSLTYLDALLYGKEGDPLIPPSEKQVSRTRHLRKAFGQFEMKRSRESTGLVKIDLGYMLSDNLSLAWPVQTFDYP